MLAPSVQPSQGVNLRPPEVDTRLLPQAPVDGQLKVKLTGHAPSRPPIKAEGDVWWALRSAT